MLNQRIPTTYSDFLEAAKPAEARFLSGRRWGGRAILMVVDAALDSIGLSYFGTIVPRVKAFYRLYVEPGEIASLKDLASLTPTDTRLRRVMNSERCWMVAIRVSQEIDKLRLDRGFVSDLEALRSWASHASHARWREDPIGKIPGVGLITFQYLRMQAGVDTTMPDRIIKRAAEKDFKITARDDLEFIRAMEGFSRETGISQTRLCLAIWLKEVNVTSLYWEEI